MKRRSEETKKGRKDAEVEKPERRRIYVYRKQNKVMRKEMKLERENTEKNKQGRREEEGR